jgi:endonuclease/exonuclease/phosphatase family metal-dependent hydrolase
MPSRRQTDQAIRVAVDAFRRLPRRMQVALLVLAAVAVVAWFIVSNLPHGGPGANQPPVTGTNPDGSGTYLFCWWNVENLFDDRDDNRRPVDEEYDNAFARDEALRNLKYEHLADVLTAMNGGHGPDILACAEVESVRAAEMLKDALNRKLDPSLQYTQIAAKNLDAGRHINTCVISRLPLRDTQEVGSRLRILETRVTVNGHDLHLVASHWTSQLSQRGGGHGESGREKYADTIYRLFADEARTDPKVDFLVCGDFNTTPDSDSVTRGLHATDDPALVQPASSNPLLLDLLGGKPPNQFGTLWYKKPLIYDHVCVSAGMLDAAGWSCDPQTVRVPTAGLIRPGATRREPWRFGNPANPPTGGRGYSDHFPVTVQLTVRP